MSVDDAENSMNGALLKQEVDVRMVHLFFPSDEQMHLFSLGVVFVLYLGKTKIKSEYCWHMSNVDTACLAMLNSYFYFLLFFYLIEHALWMSV